MRIRLSLILTFLCTALLCCTFLFSANAVAAVKPNDVEAGTAIKYSVTKDSDNKPITKLYRNPTNADNSKNFGFNYGMLDDADVVNQTVLTGGGTVGDASFAPETKTATLIKNKDQRSGSSDYFHQVNGYVAFTAEIKVPAYTEYNVDFDYTVIVDKWVSNNKGTLSVGVQLFYFGNTYDNPSAKDMSETLNFNYAESGDDPASQAFMSFDKNYSTATTHAQYTTNAGANGSTPIPTITMTNNTNQAKTYNAYFGFYSYGAAGESRYCWFTNTLTMSDTITVTAIDAPEVDKTEADFNANGNEFVFTYDNKYVDYTVSYKDVANRVSDITGSVTINSADGKCTLTDAGVYTFTFKIKDNCGAVWDSDTNDQTDKTITVTIKHKTVSAPSGTIETEYNGEKQSLATIDDPPSWYDGTVFGNPAIIAIDDEFTDAGDHEVEVTIISGEYYWNDYASNPAAARKYTFKIKKKKLEVKFTDKYGYLVAEYDDSQLYNNDKADGKKPKLITKYSKTGLFDGAVDSPTSLGKWYAIAVIENDCNYYTEEKQQFEASKKSVAYPVLSASSNPSEQYNGSNQTFVFEGFDAQLMDYKAPAGAVSFDGVTLTAKDAGDYKIEFTLKDSNFYEWSGDTDLSVTVDRKNIVITADDDNLSDWSKGEDVELKFRVTGLVSGDSVKLDASYTKGGSGASKIAVTDNGDGTHSVIIPRSYGTGEYVLTVKAADGENYVERAAATHSFKISAEGLDLGDNEIKWKLGGKTYTVADLKDGFLEIEYSGKGLTLSVDISLSESAAELEIESYGGDYTSAINVGSYTATVHIVAADPNLYTFDRTYTLNIKIVPKSLDFADAEWEWQYAGEGEWKPLTDRNMPPFDNRAVEVRISGEYFAGLGLGEGDYTVAYTHNSNLTEKGDKTTTAQITVSNRNFAVTAGTITKDWKITAKSLGYAWTGSQNITAGVNTFAFPAIEFNDGNDYTGFFEYFFTVDGEEGEFTKEELEAYIAEHWSETTVITGKVHVRPIDGQEVEIEPDSHIFTTGTPKTPLNVTINSEGSEYGNVNFVFEVKRGGADESARTVVTISDKTFAGDSAELYESISKLPAGEYRIKVSVTEDSADMYVVTGDYDYLLTIAKRNVALPALKEGITFKGETIYFKDCITGFDEEIMSLDGIDNGTEWRENGYYTTVRLTDPDNYEFEGENKSEFEYNWHIGKFVITEDMWDMSGKKGAALSLPDWVKGLLADPAQLKLDYRYYMDAHSEAMETVEFVKGTTYYVDATLTGRFADSFEFENGISFEGVQTSAKALYTVPLGSGAEQFFEDAWGFVKKNYWVVIVGIIDLILIIFVIVKLSKGRSDDEEEEEEEDDEEDDDDDDDDDDED